MNPEEYARMHALETDYWWFAGRRRIIGRLLRAVGGSCRGLRLLDIGCGTGANLPLLREAVGSNGKLAGVDFSSLALNFARQNVGAGASLLQSDALCLPFPDDAFDCVTLLDVLEHLRDDECALREVRRVLKPGGSLVFSVPAYQRLWSAHDEALHHFRRYEKQGLQRLLANNGFAPVRLSFAMSLMPPLAWLWRRLILPFQPRRPRDATRHSQGAILPQVPTILNRALIEYLALEGRLIARRPLRFGTSLVGVARKED